MVANTAPIFTEVGNIGWVQNLATASTARDGTGATVLFTAGADGARVDKVRFRSRGTNVVTVARIWINNGSASGTGTNNVLFDEITLAATTATETAQLTNYEIPLDLVLPSGYRLLVALGTTVSAGYDVIAVGGDY